MDGRTIQTATVQFLWSSDLMYVLSVAKGARAVNVSKNWTKEAQREEEDTFAL